MASFRRSFGDEVSPTARAVHLAGGMSRALRTLESGVIRRGRIPEGPYFNFEDGPELFMGRHGRGPLHIAWDTNLLLDYFNYGHSLWENDSLVEIEPNEYGEELEALQVVISLWVVRDIRFHILPLTLQDSKTKPLSSERLAQRANAWENFCAAITLVEDWPDERGETLILPPSVFDRALRAVPEGTDRQLIREAVSARMHVFMTRDKEILKARDALHPFGLLLASPQDMLEYLGACGALHCLIVPKDCLYWPMPDLQRVSHLVSALAPDVL